MTMASHPGEVLRVLNRGVSSCDFALKSPLAAPLETGGKSSRKGRRPADGAELKAKVRAQGKETHVCSAGGASRTS